MNDLARWLDDLGLGKYAVVFADSEIEFDLLSELDEADLEKLGLPMGPRKRLMRAIRELADGEAVDRGSQTARAAAEQGNIDPGVLSETRPVPGGERRQLTVMFCDLADSSTLASRFDPEDFGAIIGRFRELCAAVIGRYGGYIAKYMGDGILVYFGYPQAHERDAERAARSGLGIVEAIADYSAQLEATHDARLSVRIGIDTGPVVVGEVIGEHSAEEVTVIGEAANIAARLQALASRDTVVVGPLTRELIGATFECRDLGTQCLKGIAVPVTAWQVIAEAEPAAIHRASIRSGPLIGRDEEVGLLLRRWEQVREGHGQAVLITGDPGIGKTALVETVSGVVREQGFIRVTLRCSPYHINSALYPVIEHLKRFAHWEGGDEPELRFRKLERAFADTGLPRDEVIPLFATLLSLPLPEGEYGVLDLTPEQQKQQTFDALVAWTLETAEQAPFLHVWEDLHWADATTIELLGLLLEQVPTASILLALTWRPDFAPPWPARSHMTPLTLSRLEQAQISAMVHYLAKAKAVPEEVVRHIVSKTDGVPLYVEELTKMLLETDLLREVDGRYVLTGPLTQVAIPATLQESLLARLDRLPDRREIAQLGSVLGREFGYEMLSSLSSLDEVDLCMGLERLVEAEILYQRGRPPRAKYIFKHALIQDAAYQSLLRRTRKNHHRRIAELLEATFPERVETEPEIVAHHWTEAGCPDQATAYWHRAGAQSLRRWANHEAIAHARRGLHLLEERPGSREAVPLKIDLSLVLGYAQCRASQLVDAMKTFETAAKLAQASHSPKRLAEATLGYEEAEFFFGTAGAASGPMLESALAALGEEETVERCRLLCRLARVYHATGESERSNRTARESIDMARRLDDKESLFDALAYVVLTSLGAPAEDDVELLQRREAIEEYLALAEDLGDPDKLFRALSSSVTTMAELGDREGMEAAFARLVDAHAPDRFPVHDWVLESDRAMLAILHGDFASAESHAEEALELGQKVRGENAAGVYGMQMFTIRREQGRLAEVAPVLKRLVDDDPDEAVWRPGLALVASELGYADAARRYLDEMATGGFALPLDSKRSTSLSYLAEVCSALRDEKHAGSLYRLLLPYRKLTINVAVATICCGAASRFAGTLAALLGEWESAVDHFETAIEINRRMEAWPWLAHAQHDYACMLHRRGRRNDLDLAGCLLSDASQAAARLNMVALQRKIRTESH